MKLETRIGKAEWEVIGKEMYPKTPTKVVNVFFVICLVLGVRSYFNTGLGLALYYVVLGAVFVGMNFLVKHNRLKSNRKFYEQEYGDKELVLMYDFGEKSFEIENSITGVKTNYEYSQILRYDIANEYVFIRGEHNQHFIISKAEAEEKGLQDYLTARIPDMQVVRG